MKHVNVLAAVLSLLVLAAGANAQTTSSEPAKVGSIDTSEADCKQLFKRASEGTAQSDPDDEQYDTLALVQCSLLAQNKNPKATSDFVGVVEVGKDGKATVQVAEIAREAAKQEGDIRKTCEVIAKGTAGIAAPINPVAAAYASTFGVAQCEPFAKEAKKKNPLLLMLPPSYVGPYVLAKGGWKGVKKAAGDFTKEVSRVLPKDDKEKVLVALNPTAGVTVAVAKKACKKVFKKC